MDLLIVPVPLFNKDIAVEAYYFRHHKGNNILEASRSTSLLDGAMFSPPLELLEKAGMEALTMNKPMFVPIDSYMLLAALEKQCSQPPEKIIFLADGSDLKVDEAHLENMKRLRDLGFRFGIQKLDGAAGYEGFLKLCDYIFFDHRIFDDRNQANLRSEVFRNFRHLTCVYTHIATMERFDKLSASYEGMYEGRFYRTPLTKGQTGVTPLQANQIGLLNLVRDENFDFDDVARIVQRDTALTISLLRLVNSPYIGLRNKVKTIKHAVAMLGQKEVRKWITTAVAKLLGAEKPTELSRLSLIRARFCEEMAIKFDMRIEAQGIFLMGLFSLLDAMLECPIDEALKLVFVSDAIYDALVEHKGDYYKIYSFMLSYESADWTTVSRELILADIKTEDVYDAYIGALLWYRDLLGDEAR